MNKERLLRTIIFEKLVLSPVEMLLILNFALIPFKPVLRVRKHTVYFVAS